MMSTRTVLRIVSPLILVFLPAAVRAQGSLVIEEVAAGFNSPLGLVSAGDGTGRLFVLEQGGRVLVLEDSAVLSEPFLDLSGAVSCCDERGLLGLAFHPDYETNGFFFVNYTDRNGDTVVSRFAVSNTDSNRADSGSETEVLSFDQPFSNHNGGHLAFGPDGYLYISSGDGGSGGDPQNNAQDLGNLLGKILRVDVDGLPVASPPDNPFVGDPDAMAEIWAYGLRNPWRFSFDRETGDLFIGDVGQSSREEIDFQLASSSGGENYGWRLMEGSECFRGSTGCNDGSLVLPILEYGRNLGCSVTGGFRYRGKGSPTLDGVYLFGDFCSGTVWGATPNGQGTWTSRELADTGLAIASFGEDEQGEVYVVDLGGSVHRLVSTEFFRNGFEGGDFSGWKKKGRPRLVSPGLEGTAFAAAFAAGSGRTRVRTNAPDRETEIAIEFLLDPSELDQLDLEEAIVTLADTQGIHLELTLERLAKRFRVALYVHQETGLRRVGRAKISARKTTRLGIEWRSASAAGAADGFARLLENGGARATKTNLRTGARSVNSLQAGFPLGTKAGSGNLVLDEIVLVR